LGLTKGIELHVEAQDQPAERDGAALDAWRVGERPEHEDLSHHKLKLL
jgi:hypothetical protein